MGKQTETYMVEICCGSYYDAMQAAIGGASRIELNSALALGGLTPTTATLKLVKEQLPQLKVIAMVRPRGAGFCYGQEELQVMEAECCELLENGADGIAFGCLNPEASLDEAANEKLISMIHSYGKEAVFHRAFDCVDMPERAMEWLIHAGVERVLTSGRAARAYEGMEMLRFLQRKYGSQIEILAGSGVNAENVGEILNKTGISQVHSSCKVWKKDSTTVRNGVSFSFGQGEREDCYDMVSAELVAELLDEVRKNAAIFT